MPAATAPIRRLRSDLRDAARGLGLLGPLYRLDELRRAMRFPPPPALGPDGLPLPDRLRMMRIGNTSDWRFFYEEGARAAERIIALAAEAGAAPQGWARILDWGCGCGRIARHMPRHTAALVIGRDIDRHGVAWCNGRLKGDFGPCRLAPPLDLDPASIDFAYGYSVITHLPADMQRAWFGELKRVMRLQAVLVLTFHADTYPGAAEATFRRSSNGVAVTEWTLPGSNLVAAFQPPGTIAEFAGPGFEVVRILDGAASPFDQSVAVLRRTDHS